MNRLTSALSRNVITKRIQTPHGQSIVRNLSSQLSDANSLSIKPPSFISKEMAFGIQSATKMYMKHGVGYQKLKEIAKESGNNKTLVTRWQRMMEAFLGTQVHVIAGLGYTPNERGLRKLFVGLVLYVCTALYSSTRASRE